MSREWRVVLIHIAIVVVGALFTAFKFGNAEALTLCAGGLISLLTLVGVVWTTSRVIAKKPIALTGLSIVIKYALLGGILYYFTLVYEMDVLWLGFGVALILPSLVLFGFLSENGLTEPDDEEV